MNHPSQHSDSDYNRLPLVMLMVYFLVILVLAYYIIEVVEQTFTSKHYEKTLEIKTLHEKNTMILTEYQKLASSQYQEELKSFENWSKASNFKDLKAIIPEVLIEYINKSSESIWFEMHYERVVGDSLKGGQTFNDKCDGAHFIREGQNSVQKWQDIECLDLNKAAIFQGNYEDNIDHNKVVFTNPKSNSCIKQKAGEYNGKCLALQSSRAMINKLAEYFASETSKDSDSFPDSYFNDTDSGVQLYKVFAIHSKIQVNWPARKSTTSAPSDQLNKPRPWKLIRARLLEDHLRKNNEQDAVFKSPGTDDNLVASERANMLSVFNDVLNRDEPFPTNNSNDSNKGPSNPSYRPNAAALEDMRYIRRCAITPVYKDTTQDTPNGIPSTPPIRSVVCVFQKIDWGEVTIVYDLYYRPPLAIKSDSVEIDEAKLSSYLPTKELIHLFENEYEKIFISAIISLLLVVLTIRSRKSKIIFLQHLTSASINVKSRVNEELIRNKSTINRENLEAAFNTKFAFFGSGLKKSISKENQEKISFISQNSRDISIDYENNKRAHSAYFTSIYEVTYKVIFIDKWILHSSIKNISSRYWFFEQKQDFKCRESIKMSALPDIHDDEIFNNGIFEWIKTNIHKGNTNIVSKDISELGNDVKPFEYPTEVEEIKNIKLAISNWKYYKSGRFYFINGFSILIDLARRSNHDIKSTINLRNFDFTLRNITEEVSYEILIERNNIIDEKTSEDGSDIVIDWLSFGRYSGHKLVVCKNLDELKNFTNLNPLSKESKSIVNSENLTYCLLDNSTLSKALETDFVILEIDIENKPSLKLVFVTERIEMCTRSPTTKINIKPRQDIKVMKLSGYLSLRKSDIEYFEWLYDELSKKTTELKPVDLVDKSVIQID